MAELLWEIFGGWIRAGLIALTTYLVEHHLVTANQGDRLTSELFTHIMLVAPGVVALAWTSVQKYRSRIAFLTALELPAGSTEEKVRSTIGSGGGTPITVALLAVALGAGMLTGCATVQTGISPVADVANAGTKIEDSAHAIFVAAQQANAAGLISRQALDDVAIAVNKIGHLGLDLKAGLDAYNAAKAAGKDLTTQRAAVQQVLAAISQALQDVGKAIPPGTVQQIDQAASSILSLVAQIKGAAL